MIRERIADSAGELTNERYVDSEPEHDRGEKTIGVGPVSPKLRGKLFCCSFKYIYTYKQESSM